MYSILLWWCSFYVIDIYSNASIEFGFGFLVKRCISVLRLVCLRAFPWAALLWIFICLRNICDCLPRSNRMNHTEMKLPFFFCILYNHKIGNTRIDVVTDFFCPPSEDIVDHFIIRDDVKNETVFSWNYVFTHRLTAGCSAWMGRNNEADIGIKPPSEPFKNTFYLFIYLFGQRRKKMVMMINSKSIYKI